MVAPLVFADDKAASLRKNTYDTIPRAQSLLSLRDSHQPMQVSGCQIDDCVFQNGHNFTNLKYQVVKLNLCEKESVCFISKLTLFG